MTVPKMPDRAWLYRSGEWDIESRIQDKDEPESWVPYTRDTAASPSRVTAISQAGLKFLSALEGGMRLQMYDDGTGKAWDADHPKGYPTIGVGHLVMDDEMAELLPGITAEKGLELLKSDCAMAAGAVVALDDQLTQRLNQHEFDALVCFCFNIGVGAFARSTLFRQLTECATKDAMRAAVEEQLPRWVFSGGKRLKGLERRRNETIELFSTGDYVAGWFS